MVRFINVSGGEMLVDDSRKDEYIALGYRLADSIAVINKSEEIEAKPKKATTKRVAKKK